MKKIIFGIVALTSILALTGCFQKEAEPTVARNPVEMNEVVPSNEEETSETALSAIREKLKDEVWVKENLYLQKTCFGEEVADDSQTITFKKVGKDKVIVEAYAYDEAFGIACTLLTYQDGKVVTYGNPSVEEPAHPGHMGFGVIPEDELFVAAYMHMGYYDDTIYQIKDHTMVQLADFRANESDEQGILLENEEGEPVVEYTITKGEKEEKGTTTFDEFEQMYFDYLGGKEIEGIDIPLTDENVEEYVR